MFFSLMPRSCHRHSELTIYQRFVNLKTVFLITASRSIFQLFFYYYYYFFFIQVPITFYQSGTEDRLRTILQPKQSGDKMIASI